MVKVRPAWWVKVCWVILEQVGIQRLKPGVKGSGTPTAASVQLFLNNCRWGNHSQVNVRLMRPANELELIIHFGASRLVDGGTYNGSTSIYDHNVLRGMYS
jgi:hypothetical protein